MKLSANHQNLKSALVDLFAYANETLAGAQIAPAVFDACYEAKFLLGNGQILPYKPMASATLGQDERGEHIGIARSKRMVGNYAYAPGFGWWRWYPMGR